MNLETKRKQIDEVDKNLAGLFEKRMKIISQIFEIKKTLKVQTYDPKREQEMKERNSLYITDKSLLKYYHEFLDLCLKVSKDYQAQLSQK